MLNDLRPLTTGQLLDRTFTTYRQNFVLFAGISAIPQLCVLVVYLAALAVPGGIRAPRQIEVTAILFGLLALLISLVASYVAVAATTFGVSDVYLGKPTSIGACLARVKGKLGRVIYTSIEYGLRVAVGFMLLIVPGFYWAGKFGLAVPAVVLEDIKARDAFPRSSALTKDSVGRIIVIYFLTWLLMAVVSGGIGALLGVAGLVSHGMHPGAGSVTASLIGYLVRAFVQTVVTPVMAIALTLAYYDQRVRKEAFDIESMMSLLGEPAALSAENGTEVLP